MKREVSQILGRVLEGKKFPSPTHILYSYSSHKFLNISLKQSAQASNNSACKSTELETDMGKVCTNGGQIISYTMSNPESWACMGKSSNKEAESSHFKAEITTQPALQRAQAIEQRLELKSYFCYFF